MSSRIRNPFQVLHGLSRSEWILIAFLFAFFFLVMMTFWLLKPVRTSLLLTTMGAEETPVLKLLAVALVAAVVATYSRLSDLVGRCDIVFVALAFFAVVFSIAWITLSYAPENVRASRPIVYSVYLLVDLFSTVMLVVFWTYVNDAADPEQADRRYGPIGLGGISGGIVGSIVADAWSGSFDAAHLLLVAAALMAAAMPVVWLSDRRLGRTGRVCTVNPSEGGGFSAALEGALLVWKNSYLLLIVVLLGCHEVVSTVNTLVLNEVLDRAYDDPNVIAQMYGRLGWVINGTALAAQLFLVPALLPNKQLALLVMPVALIATSGVFLIAPAVTVVFPLLASDSVAAYPLLASDNGLNYSIQQSTRESLYVPLPAVEKYKAKAFIDMFVFRAGKALAAVLFLSVITAFGDELRLPVAINITVIVVWILAAFKLGGLYRNRYRHPGP